MGKSWRPVSSLYHCDLGRVFNCSFSRSPRLGAGKETLEKLMILDKTGLSGDFESDTKIL